MTIHLHFGMQKTASTTLQRSFQREGAWGNCLYLAYSGSQSNDLKTYRAEHALDEFRAEVERSFGAAIRACDRDHVVISSEALPLMDEGTLLALVETLQAMGRPVRMVGYVRRPASFMESIFQQRLKRRAMEPADIAGLYPQYRRKFAKFCKAQRRLGADLEFWRFDPKTLQGGCIVQDFCHRTGIDVPPGPVTTENVSLSLPAIRLLHIFRSHAPKAARQVTRRDDARALVAELGTLKGPKFHLHSGLTGPMLAEHARDIVWMEKRLETSLAEDISAHDAEAVRDLDGLLQAGPEEIAWLQARAAADAADLTPSAPPEAIAAAMARLAGVAVAERPCPPVAGADRSRETAAAGSGKTIPMPHQGLALPGYDLADVPDRVLDYPGMTSNREKGMLYWLARNVYRGEGLIVDAGLFLGASTNAFANGLKDSPTPGVTDPGFTPLNSYDIAIWVQGMDRYLTDKSQKARFVQQALNGRSMKHGKTFLPLLEDMLAAHAELIEFRIGDIVKLAAADRPVEIAFYDCLKTHERDAAAFRAFAPHYVPGQTIVIHQDYFYESAPALKIRQECLAPWFSYLGSEATSAVFRLEKPLPEEFFRDDPVADLTTEQKLALLEQAAARATDPKFRLYGRLCVVDYLLEIGKRGTAETRLAAILAEEGGDLEQRFGARMPKIVTGLHDRATAA